MEIHKALEQFLLAELLQSDRKSIGPEEDLLRSGVIDSLGILQLTAFVERQFGVRLEADDIVPENFQNLRSLGELIARRRYDPPR